MTLTVTGSSQVCLLRVSQSGVKENMTPATSQSIGRREGKCDPAQGVCIIKTDPVTNRKVKVENTCCGQL